MFKFLAACSLKKKNNWLNSHIYLYQTKTIILFLQIIWTKCCCRFKKSSDFVSFLVRFSKQIKVVKSANYFAHLMLKHPVGKNKISKNWINVLHEFQNSLWKILRQIEFYFLNHKLGGGARVGIWVSGLSCLASTLFSESFGCVFVWLQLG